MRASPPPDFTIGQYDTLPEIYGFLDDGSTPPQPVTIDVDTEVKFVLTRDGESDPYLVGTAEVVDLPTSEVRYAWAPGNTDQAGRYYARWVAQFNDGRQLTFPNGGVLAIDVTERPAVFPP